MLKQTPFQGVVELDEVYLCPHRIRSKKGRGAGNKAIALGRFLNSTSQAPKILILVVIKHINLHIIVDIP